MAIQGFIYFYILFTASVSLVSFKKGIYLIWLTFLFVPTIILEQKVKMNISVGTILIIGSVISELRFLDRRNLWKQFITENQKAIFVYCLVSFVIVSLSQTVPIGKQLRSLLTEEIAMLMFSLQTFMLVKTEDKGASVLKRIVCWAIVFNMVYCIFFEMMVGVNPAGMPLYILLGVDDNKFITDMIETERGGLGFRAQTVYRHPLSLGQYMLVLLPLFFFRGNHYVKLFFVFSICFLIIVSGSRGAIAPMILVLFIAGIKGFKSHLHSFALVLFVIFVSINFIPEKQWNKINKEVEPLVASLQFWNDKKQYENKIDGSSMEMRVNQFNAALEEIDDNPIFGRGYGYREYYIFKHNALHPDLLGFESILLLYLVERGWLGLLFFFIVTYYIYKLFSNEIADKITINCVYIGYLMSIIMTGIRPLTLLFVCFTCTIVCGVSGKRDEESDNMLERLSVETNRDEYM